MKLTPKRVAIAAHVQPLARQKQFILRKYVVGKKRGCSNGQLFFCIFAQLFSNIYFVMRYFNTSGPCNKEEHYMIESSSRLHGVEQLIDMKQYFVIHAARQSGKTTYLLDLTKKLNAEGKYHTLYCSLEGLQEINDAEKGIPLIIECIKDALCTLDIPKREFFAENADYFNFTGVLNSELKKYCRILDKPLVIFFDEADCLSEGTLISFLRQLRLGYINRVLAPFVHSVALVGMRNIRDYKAKIRPDRETLGSASPFNIVTKALTLTNFTKEEITSFYDQHTKETGQKFEEEAIDFIYKQTQGQPWLVNAVAREVIVEILQLDYTQPVTAKMADEAIQTIILQRDTHIDSLLERLKEERVRKIIEPLITGGDNPIDRLSDDYQYVCDLGLITTGTRITPSNPIYGEVIARYLSLNFQSDFVNEQNLNQTSRYLYDNQIDMDKLMRDFQQFWRENSDIWKQKYQYQEAAPHLILMAFLQRIVNGGGQVLREMAAGTGRTDLCIVYEDEKYPVELKIRRNEKTLQEGLEQTVKYMDTFNCTEGWLVIFDQRPEIAWDDKIYIKQETINEKTITVVGL
jgi:transposase